MANIGARRSGRTTRQADANIQLLFEEGACLVKDHYNNEEASKRLQYIILKRLEYEHGIKPHQLFFGNTKEPNELRGYDVPGFMIDYSRRDIRYFYIILRDKRKHAPLNEDDKGNPIEELPDVEFQIPGMIHRKGIDPDDLANAKALADYHDKEQQKKGFQLGEVKKIPQAEFKGSRYDKFNK